MTHNRWSIAWNIGWRVAWGWWRWWLIGAAAYSVLMFSIGLVSGSVDLLRGLLMGLLGVGGLGAASGAVIGSGVALWHLLLPHHLSADNAASILERRAVIVVVILAFGLPTLFAWFSVGIHSWLVISVLFVVGSVPAFLGAAFAVMSVSEAADWYAETYPPRKRKQK